MKIDLHEISIIELTNLKNSHDVVLNFRLEYEVDIDKLNILNEILAINDLATLMVILNMGKIDPDEPLKPTIEVFKYLKAVQNLTVIVNISDIPLGSLSFLSELLNLKKLMISRYVKKAIDFEPLYKLNKLTHLNYDCHGLNKKQHTLLNVLNDLQYLSVFDLDLSLIETNKELKNLAVLSKMLNSELILEKFPNLESIALEKCKDINLQNTIANYMSLTNIVLRYMNHIVEIPKFKSADKIKKFGVISLGKLENIDAIMEMTNLEELSITDIKILKCKDFEKLSALKKLKKVYAFFKSNKENDDFKKLSEKNGWIH